jgi:hypothetical protein
VLRQVDHDAFARRHRQQPAFGHDDLGADARQPGVHPGIRVGDFLVAEAVAAGQVEQRFLPGSLHREDFADHVAACGGQRVLIRRGRRQGRHERRQPDAAE